MWKRQTHQRLVVADKANVVQVAARTAGAVLEDVGELVQAQLPHARPPHHLPALQEILERGMVCWLDLNRPIWREKHM